MGGVVFLFVFDRFAIHQGAALGTTYHARQDVVGCDPAGVIHVLGAFFQAAGIIQVLHGLEGFFGDHWFDVVGDDLIAIVKFAAVDPVLKEVFDAAVGGVQIPGGNADVRVGCAFFPHLPGKAGTVPGFGIGYPFVDNVGFAIPVRADVDRFTFEAAGRGAGDAAIFADQVAQAAFDIGGEVIQEALVHPVDGGLKETAVEAIWYLVLDAEDLIAAAAEVGFVELGVVDVAGEAGELPDDDALLLGCAGAEVVHHGLESLAGDGGGARAGFVLEDGGEGETFGLAPGANFFFLLLDGEFLFFSA